jgi:hypothetical protein
MNIFISLYTPNNNCSVDTLVSILETEKYFADKETNISLNLQFGNDMGRSQANKLAMQKFMDNSDYTHLLLLDRNVRFSPSFVEALLKADKKFIGGITPLPVVKWQSLLKDSVSDKIAELKELISNDDTTQENANKATVLLLKYIQAHVAVYDMEFSDNLEVTDSLLEISYLSSKFLLLNREAVDALVTCDFVSDKELCNQWIENGEKIYTDVRLTMNLLGDNRFTSNLLTVLQS